MEKSKANHIGFSIISHKILNEPKTVCFFLTTSDMASQSIFNISSFALKNINTKNRNKSKHK